MKNIILTLSILLVTIATLSAQNTLQVYNTTAPLGTGAYNSIQAAVDAASGGDIIYVNPGLYQEIVTITKRVIIMGPGYRLTDNFPESINTSLQHDAVATAIHLVSGSLGSSIIGMHLYDIQMKNTESVIVERCYLAQALLRNTNNTIVRKSYVYYDNAKRHWASHNNYSKIVLDSLVSNALFENNILDYYVNYTFRGRSGASGTVVLRNNVIVGSIDGGSSIVYNAYNNIFSHSSLGFQSATISVIRNNVFVDDAVSGVNSSSNKMGHSRTSIFKGYGHSNNAGLTFDQRFELTAGSPAAGYGISGEDCGIYGGEDPYILSGLPPIPVIYHLDVPFSATTEGGLDVTIKVKSSN